MDIKRRGFLFGSLLGAAAAPAVAKAAGSVLPKMEPLPEMKARGTFVSSCTCVTTVQFPSLYKMGYGIKETK